MGDVSLDEYFRPLSWPPVAKLDIDPLGAYVGGMIANAAAVHAGLGDPARFLWTMRPGEFSQRLLADLEALGVDTSLVTFADHLGESRNLILLVDGDHVVMTPTLGLDAIDLSDDAVEAMSQARFVYTAIGDLLALRHGDAGPREVIDRFRAAGAPLILDLDVCATRPDEDLLARVDVLVVNSVGFDRLAGGRAADDVVPALLAAGTSIVVRTLGAHGCRVSAADGEVVVVAGLDVDVVDVTGAGDTFAAAFAYALGRTDDLAGAATFATGAAALAVTAMGARSGIATIPEVADFLGRYGLSVSLYADARPLPVPLPSERHIT